MANEGFLVTCLCFLVVFILLYLIQYLLQNRQETPLSSINSMISQFHHNLDDAQETIKVLTEFKKKIHSNKSFAKDSAKIDFLVLLIKSIEKVPTTDKRIVLTIDIINEILAIPENRQLVFEDIKSTKYFIDLLLIQTQSIFQCDYTSDENAFVYKFLLSLGLIASENTSCQSYLGDRGVIEFLIKLISNSLSSNFFKWSCFALFNLTHNHPANQREFFVSGGIPLVIEQLKRLSDSTEAIQQGLPLLLNILEKASPSYKVFDARQQGLANGLADVVFLVQKQYRKSEEIQFFSERLLKVLMSDWLSY